MSNAMVLATPAARNDLSGWMHDLQASVGDTLAMPRSALLESGSGLAGESMRYWGLRVQASMEYLHKLGRCSGPGDLMALNTAFVSSSAGDLFDHGHRCLMLITRPKGRPS
jgi:hypothetical protein